MYRFVRTIKALLIRNGSDRDERHKAHRMEIPRQCFSHSIPVNIWHDKPQIMF